MKKIKDLTELKTSVKKETKKKKVKKIVVQAPVFINKRIKDIKGGLKIFRTI